MYSTVTTPLHLLVDLQGRSKAGRVMQNGLQYSLARQCDIYQCRLNERRASSPSSAPSRNQLVPRAHILPSLSLLPRLSRLLPSVLGDKGENSRSSSRLVPSAASRYVARNFFTLAQVRVVFWNRSANRDLNGPP